MDSITIKDRKFFFKAPTAWDGCTMYDRLAAYSIPFGGAAVIGLRSNKRPMPREELKLFQQLCLRYCYEVEENGVVKPSPIPVVDTEGELGINDATAPLLTKLTTQYIVFFINWWQAESD